MRWRAALAALALVAMAGAGAAFWLRSRGPEPTSTLGHGVACASCTQAAPHRLDDPIAPGRALLVAGNIESLNGRSENDDWVLGPPPETQPVSADPKSCSPELEESDEPLFQAVPPGGIYRSHVEPNENGEVDVIMHFHGHDLALVHFAESKVPIVWYAVRQRGGDFRSQLGGPEAFEQLMAALMQTLEKRYGRPIRARRVALSAWSGGYEAILVMLERSRNISANAILLLDGLHAARRPEVATQQLAPLTAFAKRAAAGEAFLLMTHSSIIPPSYASSTEAVHRVLAGLGARPVPVERRDAMNMELLHAFSRNHLHARGYSGGKKPDHCAHLALYPMALDALAQYWQLP